MFTPDEAKKEWCPFARYPGAGIHNNAPVGINRAPGQSLPPEARCLGPGCMAWRWKHAESAGEPASERVGYCGLAGKPE